MKGKDCVARFSRHLLRRKDCVTNQNSGCEVAYNYLEWIHTVVIVTIKTGHHQAYF